MSLLGRLRGLFREAPDPEPDPEDLLAFTGAALTVERRVGLGHAGEAALCFAPADGEEFSEAQSELDDVLAAAESETGTTPHFRDDDHGFRWLALEDEDVEDLASGLQFAASTFEEAAHGDQLLAAVLAFSDDDDAAASRSDAPTGSDPATASDDATTAYLVYSFERGRFYPFVPEGADDRDGATEFRLQSALREELPFEGDRSQWFPLWPERAGEHPWS